MIARPPEKQGEKAPRAPKHPRTAWLGFLAVLAALLGCVLSVPVQLPVDGHEYLCTVASLLYTHNMLVEREDLLRAAEMVSPETFFVAPLTKGNPEPGENAKRNKHGDWMWGSHSYYVALAALPFVLAFGAKGFLVLNALCLTAVLALLYRHLRERNPSRAAFLLSCACVLLSGAVTYVFWINSELLILAAVSGALYFGLRSRPLLGSGLLAAATAVKPPLVFLLLPMLLWQWSKRRSIRLLVWMALAFVLTGLPQLVFYYHYFGHFQARDAGPAASIVETAPTPDGDSQPRQLAKRHLPQPAQEKRQRAAAATKSPPQSNTLLRSMRSLPHLFGDVSWIRIRAFWIAPGTGMIWFYPALFWCLLRNRWPLWFLAVLLASAALVSVTSLVPVNLYAAQSGTRYAILVLPVFLVLPGRWKGTFPDWAAMLVTAFLGGALAMDATQPPRNFEQIHANAFPSMALVRDWGLTLYPEVLFQAGRRWDRDVAFDYVDHQDYLRHNRVQLMARNMRPGEIIVKLVPDAGYPPAAIGFSTASGTVVERPLHAARVATVRVPIAEDDMTVVAYPEYRRTGNSSVPTAVLTARLSGMMVKEGNGELRWQYRHHAADAFLYRVGPRIVSVYPSADWMLYALASEDLRPQDVGDVIDQLVSTSPGVFVSLDAADRVEGERSLGIRNADTTRPRVDVVASKTPLEGPQGRYGEIEVVGWMKLESVAPVTPDGGHARVGVTINWFDEEDYFIEQSPAWQTDAPASWELRRARLAVPNGARAFSLGIVFENAVGTVKLDDVAVSWFKERWELRH